MDSSAPECAALKKRYDECYSKWRSELSLGTALQDVLQGRGLGLDKCDATFSDYRDCAQIVMKIKIQQGRPDAKGGTGRS